MSSHILSEVAALCERVVILDHGRVVAEQSGEGLAAADPLAAGLAARTIVLSWDGDRDRVAAALARVAGVDDVTITATGAEVNIAGNAVEIRPAWSSPCCRRGRTAAEHPRQGPEPRGPVHAPDRG